MTVPDATPDDVTALGTLLAGEVDGKVDELAAHILASSWLAERDAHVRAEALREAVAEVRWVYDLQCPVRPAEDYAHVAARWAHLWWQRVLGAVLEDLTECADAIERGESR